MKKLKIIILLTCLNIPVLLHILGVTMGEELKGSYETIRAVQWNPASFNNGKLAESITDNIEAHFFGRPLLIRTRNQIDYTLFKEIHSKNVIQGKEGYLFEQSYINAVSGADEIDYSLFNARMTFFDSAIHIPQLFLLAPGKGSYYKEYVPQFYFQDSLNENANYKTLSRLLQDKGHAVIDLWKWANLHKSDPVTLFPKNGIHWSEFFITHAVQMVSKSIPGINFSVTRTL